MSSNNMYRVGDFVYFEVSASAPYQIRKIEELNKTPTGAVEAKVVCYYRRRDLSSNLIELADKHQKEFGLTGDENPDSLRQIRHRELFLSRHLETLPATHIRGKCTVNLHTESEPYHTYLLKEDAFFFQLVYEPLQKTLQADRGSIRIGSQYQADVGEFVKPDEDATDDDRVYEELCWQPDNNLTSSDVSSYMLFVRSLGTLGRAYYSPHILRQPSLTMTAAVAARDTTHQFALDTLHSCSYDVTDALKAFAPDSQPVVKLDEMEQWSASEGNLFEEALLKYGKCFNEIQKDFLPWKSLKSLIEFYYMWKTTDHYIQQKQMKATEAEHHLKQVYIPNYNKPNPAVLYPPPGRNFMPNAIPAGCEGCSKLNSVQWYALGPATSPLKVCADCWNYWKRYGDLKTASILDKVIDNSLPLSDAGVLNSAKPMHLRHVTDSSAGSPGDLVKPGYTGIASKARTGANFYFAASFFLRLARRLCSPFKPRHQARQPFKRLAVLANLHKEAFPIISKLTTSQLQILAVKHFQRSKMLHENGSPGSILHALTARLLSNQMNSSVLLAKANSLCTNSAGSDRSVPNSTNESALDLAINGVLATNMINSLKRHISGGKSDELGSFKRQHIESAGIGHVPHIAGSKRRFSVRFGSNEVSTMMFCATPSIKRSRRRLLCLSELRRFGRQPWNQKVLASSPNGFQNGSSTAGCRRKAVVTTHELVENSVSPAVDSSSTYASSRVLKSSNSTQ